MQDSFDDESVEDKEESIIVTKEAYEEKDSFDDDSVDNEVDELPVIIVKKPC